jgi:hypothetical protein
VHGPAASLSVQEGSRLDGSAPRRFGVRESAASLHALTSHCLLAGHSCALGGRSLRPFGRSPVSVSVERNNGGTTHRFFGFCRAGQSVGRSCRPPLPRSAPTARSLARGVSLRALAPCPADFRPRSAARRRSRRCRCSRLWRAAGTPGASPRGTSTRLVDTARKHKRALSFFLSDAASLASDDVTSSFRWQVERRSAVGVAVAALGFTRTNIRGIVARWTVGYGNGGAGSSERHRLLRSGRQKQDGGPSGGESLVMCCDLDGLRFRGSHERKERERANASRTDREVRDDFAASTSHSIDETNWSGKYCPLPLYMPSRNTLLQTRSQNDGASRCWRFSSGCRSSSRLIHGRGRARRDSNGSTGGGSGPRSY